MITEQTAIDTMMQDLRDVNTRKLLMVYRYYKGRALEQIEANGTVAAGNCLIQMDRCIRELESRGKRIVQPLRA